MMEVLSMDPENNSAEIAIVAISKRGVESARRLKLLFPKGRLYLPEKWAAGVMAGEHTFTSPVKEVIATVFQQCRHLVLIMSVGIAVRLISTLLIDKHHDPTT